MPDLNDKTLQQLFDEELDADEAERAREALEASPEDQLRMEALGQMRAMLRTEVETAVDEADLDGMWSGVQARIGEAPPASAWARFTEWLGGSMGAHPLRWAAAGVCTVAVAVLVGVLISSGPEGPDPLTPKTDQAHMEPKGEGDLDIERIEFKNRHPDIFRIKDGKSSTTVIWIYPDEDEDEDIGSDTDDTDGSAGPI